MTEGEWKVLFRPEVVCFRPNRIAGLSDVLAFAGLRFFGYVMASSSVWTHHIALQDVTRAVEGSFLGQIGGECPEGCARWLTLQKSLEGASVQGRSSRAHRFTNVSWQRYCIWESPWHQVW